MLQVDHRQSIYHITKKKREKEVSKKGDMSLLYKTILKKQTTARGTGRLGGIVIHMKCETTYIHI